MAALTIFQTFPADVANGVHNLATDQLAVALTNVAPTASSDGQLSDLTEISYTNLSSRNITTTSSTQSSGTYSLVLEDLTLTASGAVAEFRYVVIYNDGATNDELIGYYDYGEGVTLANGETFKIDFNQDQKLIEIAIS